MNVLLHMKDRNKKEKKGKKESGRDKYPTVYSFPR